MPNCESSLPASTVLIRGRIHNKRSTGVMALSHCRATSAMRTLTQSNLLLLVQRLSGIHSSQTTRTFHATRRHQGRSYLGYHVAIHQLVRCRVPRRWLDASAPIADWLQNIARIHCRRRGSPHANNRWRSIHDDLDHRALDTTAVCRVVRATVAVLSRATAFDKRWPSAAVINASSTTSSRYGSTCLLYAPDIRHRSCSSIQPSKRLRLCSQRLRRRFERSCSTVPSPRSTRPSSSVPRHLNRSGIRKPLHV